jgi:glycosyltransferase involved in cell wall biosynthesis
MTLLALRRPVARRGPTDPRVAIGPTEVAGCAAALGLGLRRVGAAAEVVLWSPSPYGFAADRVLGRLARVAYALRAPARNDVLHYQFGSTWLPFFVDARWSRLWRRTIVVTYHGDDCRLYGIARTRFPARGRAGDPAGDEHVRRRVQRLARTSHAALVADLELATYVAPFYRRVYVTPLPLYPDSEPDRRDPGSGSAAVVVHAASDPRIKGTDVIVSAAEAVARRVDLDFRLLTGVPRARVLEELARADIVIDQLNSVTSGIFALEAMRRGLPVLGEIDPAALAPYQAELPLVRVTPALLERELEALVRDPDRRARIGAAGREYVKRRHSEEAVGRTMLALYRHARESEPGAYEATADGIRRLDWAP